MADSYPTPSSAYSDTESEVVIRESGSKRTITVTKMPPVTLRFNTPKLDESAVKLCITEANRLKEDARRAGFRLSARLI